MLIRDEKESDHDSVYAVNKSAFETPSEADLVDALRQQAQPVVSLVPGAAQRPTAVLELE